MSRITVRVRSADDRDRTEETRMERTRQTAEFYRLRRRLRMAIGALIAVVAVGTLGYTIIGASEHNVVDAIYMTVITLTTVGFGEIIDMTNNPAARLFTVLLVLVGMGIVAYSIPQLAAFVIEGQLSHTFARRRMEKRISQMKNHYLVCGDTADAAYVAVELVRTGRQVVLVGTGEDGIRDEFEDLTDVPRVHGDPSADDVLGTANIQHADGVVVCLEDDKENMVVVLTARRLAPKVRMVAAAEHMDSEAKLRAAGADAVVCASRIGGLRMASELVRPKVVSFLDRMLRDTRSSLRVEEISVPSSAATEGQSISSLRVDEVAGAVLLAIQRPGSDEFDFNPPTDTPLQQGMTLVVMADAEGRARLEERLA